MPKDLTISLMEKISPDVNNWESSIKGWGHFIQEWFIRDVMYFNTTLEQYKVINHYVTSNYFRKDDCNGVQAILL